MLNNYLIVAPSKNGDGLFTSININKDSPILEMRGDLVKLEDSGKIDAQLFENYYLQISPDTYLGPSGSIDDKINHSCKPNCYLHIIGNRVILYALHFIKAGAELTFDYSTTSTESKEDWVMQCNCGDFNCRKEISGYNYLPDSIKQSYEEKRMIPIYIKAR
jgi:hypothetical protein